MATMDIFNQDAFSMVNLTDVIIKKPYQPSLVRDMGLFEKQSVTTTTIQLEQKVKGQIGLVQTSPRGSAPSLVGREGRDIRPANTVRLADGFSIYADEVQGIRAFGKETELETVAKLVSDRMEEVNDRLALTEENMMLGALQGKVLDADGTIINNWFSFWGKNQPSEISFDFTADATTLGKQIRDEIQRKMLKSGMGLITPNVEIIGLCGDNFFDAITGCEAYRGNTRTPEAEQRLFNEYGNAYGAITFGGVTWINYRGTDDGTTVAIATDEVKFFPKGAKGLFKQALAPAEFMETVNTLGKERYVKMIHDTERNMWVKGEVYTNPLFYCTRPEVLLRGKKA